MDKLEKGELVTLDNDKEYYIYEIIEIEGNRYAYMTLNTEDENQMEVMICKEIATDSETNLELVTDKKLLQTIAEQVLKGTGE